MKRTALLLVACISLLLATATVKSQPFAGNQPGGWAQGLQDSKLFIENHGQFKLPAIAGLDAPVRYAYDGGPTHILFTSKGVVYYFSEKHPKHVRDAKEIVRESRGKFTSLEDHMEREREEHAVEYKRDFVSALWEGANENAEIITEDKAPEYFSYNFYEGGQVKNVNFIYGYKKITYKNLYPNIDVEYIFHPDNGIKYSFILHPGANPSQIKIRYSDRPHLLDNGDIHVRTRFGDIVEHAPKTFYTGNKSQVGSAFLVNGKTASFYLSSYDNTQSLTIDPWVQTPTLNNSNGVWECESDAAGNVYIIGGDSPMKLLKYNSGGTLQWTYVTPWDTANDWLGTLTTDKAGNSYVTSGSIAALNKVNTSGSVVWSYNASAGSVDEYWSISLNCDETKLIVAGTSGTAIPQNLYGCIFDINTSNGSVNSKKKIGSMQGFLINEGRSLTSSYNARYYYLTLDTIGCIDQNFGLCPNNTSIFAISDGYTLGYKCENYRPPNGNSGIKSIRANKFFVYTANGTTVQKRSLTTGAVLGSAAIPGGLSSSSGGRNAIGNSGIDIDTCGNVYVGSGDRVVKYDANLNLLTSTSLPFHVYDVAVSTGGNIIVSGATGIGTTTSRTGYVQSINMGACNYLSLVCCDPTICPAGPFCTTAPSTTLTVATTGGTWTGAGVNSSGVFNPATAGPGTHNIVYTLPCGVDSISITVTPCATLSVCQGGGNITASGGTPGYTWQTQTTYTNCSGCPGGTCLPPFCNGVVTTSLTTIATNTNSIPAPSSYPLIITDAVGNTYTITTLSSVPSCSACVTPTVSVSSTQSVTCFGASTGAATLTVNPAVTYTATWQPGNLTGLTQSGLAAGVYTVTITDGSSCSATTTVNIAGPTALTASITANSPASCGANNGSLTVTASGGTAGYTYTWTPSGGNAATASGLAGGSYTVTVHDANSCSVTATASVSSTTTPTLTVNSSTVCAGTAATLTVTGATTYSWSPATGLSATTGTNVTATPTTTTIYTVTGTAGTCSSTATSTVTVNPVPTATATGTQLVCTGQTINLGVTTTATTFSWSGPNSFTSNVQNPSISSAAAANSGTYTVTVTDNGCSAVSTISVTVTNSTSVSITPAGPFCSGNLPTNLSATPAGGTWTGTGITNGANGTFDPAVAGVGTFTVTYSISGSCGSSDSIAITVNAGPTATATVNSAIVCAGQSINLGVNTTAGATYSWSGPSGYTTNVQNPVISPAAVSNSGIYTVTVSNGSCTGTDTIGVTVVSNPTITVNSATICSGTSTTLTANGATTFTWSPATGLSTTSGSVVTASPGSTTIYTVTGNVGTCAAVPGTSTVSVNASPTITVNNASICSSTSVTITVNGASTYTWSPASGLNTTNGSVVVANPGASTTYTVIGTDVNGCTDTTSVTVQNSPSITTTVTTSSVTCNGLANGSATVAASGGTGPFTYSWSPVGGTNSSAINIAAGTYTCVVTDSIGCTATATLSITQPNALTVNVVSGIVCVGQSYSLTATPAGGTGPYTYNWNTGTSTSNPYVVTPPSSSAYTLVVVDSHGCTVTDTSIVVAVRPPLQVTANNIYICAGNTGTLSATASGGNGTYTYTWTPGNLSGSTVAVTPSVTTVYTITVSDGCTTPNASDTALITVTPPPNIPAPVPAQGCAPQCVTFANPPGLNNWMWDFGDGYMSGQSNPVHCYQTAGSFNISLSYTTTTGCASSVTYSNVVNIYPVPVANFNPSPDPTDILDPLISFHNTSVNAGTWQWTFGDGTSSTATNPQHTYTQPGQYNVVLIATNQYGCKDTITELVIVNDIFTFYAPNAFSPNDDNVNPVFLPIGEGWDDNTYTLWVFDRWGNLVYKTNDAHKGWDGRFREKGDGVQEDTYVWRAQVNDLFGKQHQYTGTVNLVK